MKHNKYKTKRLSKADQLQAAIQSQYRDMAQDNQIAHHRDNETNRRIEGKPSRRKTA